MRLEIAKGSPSVATGGTLTYLGNGNVREGVTAPVTVSTVTEVESEPSRRPDPPRDRPSLDANRFHPNPTGKHGCAVITASRCPKAPLVGNPKAKSVADGCGLGLFADREPAPPAAEPAVAVTTTRVDPGNILALSESIQSIPRDMTSFWFCAFWVF